MVTIGIVINSTRVIGIRVTSIFFRMSVFFGRGGGVDKLGVQELGRHDWS